MLLLRCDSTNTKAVFTILHCGKMPREMKLWFARGGSVAVVPGGARCWEVGQFESNHGPKFKSSSLVQRGEAFPLAVLVAYPSIRIFAHRNSFKSPV